MHGLIRTRGTMPIVGWPHKLRCLVAACTFLLLGTEVAQADHVPDIRVFKEGEHAFGGYPPPPNCADVEQVFRSVAELAAQVEACAPKGQDCLPGDLFNPPWGDTNVSTGDRVVQKSCSFGGRHVYQLEYLYTPYTCQNFALGLSGGGQVKPSDTLKGLVLTVSCNDPAPIEGVAVQVVSTTPAGAKGFLARSTGEQTQCSGGESQLSCIVRKEGPIQFNFIAPAQPGVHQLTAFCQGSQPCSTAGPIAVVVAPCDIQLSLQGGGTRQVEPGDTLPDDLVLTATCDGKPVKDVEVAITSKAQSNTGSHQHHDEQRPPGAVSPPSGKTGEGGEFRFSFTAPAPAGVHDITARCTDQAKTCNQAGPAKVTVKIEGIEAIPTSDLYTLSEADGSNIGDKPDGKHNGVNHNLTPEAAAVLERLAFEYAGSFENPGDRAPEKLHINDASLMWGGLFDIAGNWKPEHHEHRRGTVVDIRANLRAGKIPESEFDRFKKKAAKRTIVDSQGNTVSADVHCSSKKYAVPACLKPDGTVDSGRHFHVRLLGKKE